MGRKRITGTAKFILGLWNVALFALVWLAYYNERTYHSHADIGAVGTILVFAIVYFWFKPVNNLIPLNAIKLINYIIGNGFIAIAVFFDDITTFDNFVINLIENFIKFGHFAYHILQNDCYCKI